jgi:hypothetical protein
MIPSRPVVLAAGRSFVFSASFFCPAMPGKPIQKTRHVVGDSRNPQSSPASVGFCFEPFGESF